MAFVHESAEVIGQVRVGARASIWPHCVLRGDVHRIAVGEGANIQDLCTIHGNHDRPALIGKGVSVGHGSTLHGCRVGKGSLIGMGAIVLECVIGRESLVGAGALVPAGMRVPARSLVLGLPARVVRRLTAAEIRRLKRTAAVYEKLARRHKRQSHAVR